MNSDQIDDLKQFILALVSQVEARLTTGLDELGNKSGTLADRQGEMAQKLNAMSNRLHKVSGRVGEVSDRLDKVSTRLDKLEFAFMTLNEKVDDGFAGIGEAIDQIHRQLETAR